MSTLDRYTIVGTPIAVASELDPTVTSMLLGFESLGVDCEFGLVQRRFGAEASGLLRWATTPLGSLITMIENDFRGIGELERTSLQTASWGEVFIIDHTYHLYNHTFVIDTDIDHARFLEEQCSRLRHLVGKIRKVLDAHDRILVYKSNERLSRADAVALYAALRRYGPQKLVCVTPDDSDRETPITVLQDGLALASLHHAGPTQGPGGAVWDIDFARWLRICEDAGASLRPAWTRTIDITGGPGPCDVLRDKRDDAGTDPARRIGSAMAGPDDLSDRASCLGQHHIAARRTFG